MLESKYQTKLIKKIKKRLPGSEVLKNDSSYLQGIPDLSVFYGPHYGFLEVKAAEDSDQQPNQDHYVNKFNDMSFGAFIYPENEVEVLDALCESFGVGRKT